MRPRPGQKFGVPPRRPQCGDRAKRVVPVPIRPAGDQEHRTLDVVVDRTNRPVLPVVIAAGVLEPAEQPGLVFGDPRGPFVAPSIAPHRGYRGQRIHRRHVVAVVHQVQPTPRTTAQVDVVGETVIRGVDRDHGLQPGCALGRHLERVEAAVGRAVHPDVAVAPLLRGDPGDHLGQVWLLLELVFVNRTPAAAAGAANIQTRYGIVELVAQSGVLRAIGGCQIILAVGQSFQDARLWTTVGQVQGDREACTVRHRYPLVAPATGHGVISIGRTWSSGRASMVRPPTPVVVVAHNSASMTASSVASTVASK